MIRIVLVAEPVLFRSALATALSTAEDMQVVGEIASADEVTGRTAEIRPDVVVADLASRFIDLDILQKLCKEISGCSVLVLAPATPRTLRRVLESGVRGLVSRDRRVEQLVDAIRRVAEGERVIEPATAVVTLLRGANPMTDREKQVLRLAAEGMTAAEIARKLHLTPGTVRNYLSVIVRKTGARNRLEAIRIAERADWLG